MYFDLIKSQYLIMVTTLQHDNNLHIIGTHRSMSLGFKVTCIISFSLHLHHDTQSTLLHTQPMRHSLTSLCTLVFVLPQALQDVLVVPCG